MKSHDCRFPMEILFDKRMDSLDRLVAISCYSFANWKPAEASFSLKGLSLRAGIKDLRTVRTRLKKLENWSWLQIETKPGRKSRYKLKPLASYEGTIEEQGIYSLIQLTNSNSKTHTHSKRENTHNDERGNKDACTEDADALQSVSDKEDRADTGSGIRVGENVWSFLGRTHSRRYSESG